MHQDDGLMELESANKRRDVYPAVFFRLQKADTPTKAFHLLASPNREKAQPCPCVGAGETMPRHEQPALV